MYFFKRKALKKVKEEASGYSRKSSSSKGDQQAERPEARECLACLRTSKDNSADTALGARGEIGYGI